MRIIKKDFRAIQNCHVSQEWAFLKSLLQIWPFVYHVYQYLNVQLKNIN